MGVGDRREWLMVMYGKDDELKCYMIRDIPEDVWADLKAKAAKAKQPLKQILFCLIVGYVKGEIEIKNE